MISSVISSLIFFSASGLNFAALFPRGLAPGAYLIAAGLSKLDDFFFPLPLPLDGAGDFFTFKLSFEAAFELWLSLLAPSSLSLTAAAATSI